MVVIINWGLYTVEEKIREFEAIVTNVSKWSTGTRTWKKWIGTTELLTRCWWLVPNSGAQLILQALQRQRKQAGEENNRGK